MAQELYELSEGWEWTGWSDALEIIGGKNQKNVVADDGEYPIYGSGGEMGRAKDFLCPAFTTIIGRKGTINRPLYIELKFHRNFQLKISRRSSHHAQKGRNENILPGFGGL